MSHDAAIQVVGAIIEDGGGLVLLAQRPPGKKLAGMWEFPGGKIESGESAPEALKRELKEELELEVEILQDLGGFDHTYDFGRIHMTVYVVRALGTPRPTADVQVFKWIEPRCIDQKTLAPADIPPLLQYLRAAR